MGFGQVLDLFRVWDGLGGGVGKRCEAPLDPHRDSMGFMFNALLPLIQQEEEGLISAWVARPSFMFAGVSWMVGRSGSS